MVRNPRTLMVCSLLALATGLALGSRLAPTATNVAAGGRVPALVERTEAWPAWAPPDASADVRISDAIPVDAGAKMPDDVAALTENTGLEGDRHPRMPRMSRETMARAAR